MPLPFRVKLNLNIAQTEARKLQVYEALSSGSDPRGSFFLLVGVSTLIAAFGLIMNSTAVVIGAMLVAPLMTPILGLALALVRGDVHLLGISLRSEAMGVVVAIVAATLLGAAIPYFDPTPEMLARTHPNLFDLMVAVFAGLAGAYALVNEKLSPVLPGVAISTAIVPPLANVGLSLSLGAYQGALGSFLLFFTNFLSILLVSSVVFFLAGMAEEMQSRRGAMLARRFGVAVIGFVVVGVLLSGELIRMFDQQRLARDIREALTVELTEFAISDMSRLLHKDDGERVLILADVNGPTEINPRQIEQVQARLAEVIGKPVQLYLRIAITHDVSADGAIGQTAVETLDGFFSPAEPSERVNHMQLVEQIIREYLDDLLSVHLERVESVPVGDFIAIVATFGGIRKLDPNEIHEIQERIQARLGDSRLRLVANQRESTMSDGLGGVRPEIQRLGDYSQKQADAYVHLGQAAKHWLAQRAFWLEGWTTTFREGVNIILLEINGPELFTQQNLEDLRDAMIEDAGVPIKIYVRSRQEALLGTSVPMAFEDLLQRLREQNEAAYPEEYTEILRGVR